MSMLIFLIGILLCCMVLFSCVDRKQCTETVKSVCIGEVAYQNSNIVRYSPKFEYHYNGIDYVGQSTETFTYKKVHKQFIQGSSYWIYLNPRKPTCICITKGIHSSDALILGIGCMLILCGLSFIR